MKLIYFFLLLLPPMQLCAMDAEKELKRVIINALLGKDDEFSLYSKILDQDYVPGQDTINSFAPVSSVAIMDIPENITFLSPLTAAILEGNLNTIKALFRFYPETLSAGAKGSNYGEGPLHFAAGYAKKNNAAITDLLLTKKDALVNGTDSGERTSLYLASEKGDLDVVSLLLHNDARTDIQTGQGETPLSIARKKGYNAIVKALEKNINDENRSLTRNLIIAITKNPTDQMVRSTIVRLTDRNKYVRDVVIEGMGSETLGYTFNPLSAAAFYSKNDIVKLLLDPQYNIDVNATYPLDKMTALHWAVESNNLVGSKMLLDHGADPDIQEREGKTALARAQEKGFQDIVNLLAPVTGKKKTEPVKTDVDLINALNSLDQSLNILLKKL